MVTSGEENHMSSQDHLIKTCVLSSVHEYIGSRHLETCLDYRTVNIMLLLPSWQDAWTSLIQTWWLYHGWTSSLLLFCRRILFDIIWRTFSEETKVKVICCASLLDKKKCWLSMLPWNWWSEKDLSIICQVHEAHEPVFLTDKRHLETGMSNPIFLSLDVMRNMQDGAEDGAEVAVKIRLVK